MFMPGPEILQKMWTETETRIGTWWDRRVEGTEIGKEAWVPREA